MLGRVEKQWSRLGGRQKLALVAVGGWSGAWVVSQILDSIKAAVPGTYPVLTAITHFLTAYIVTKNVAMLVLGGTIVGFGPNVWTYIRTREIGTWAGCLYSLVFVGMVIFAIGFLVMQIWFVIIDSPKTYSPPEHATKGRVFTSRTPLEIERPFSKDTRIRAERTVDKIRGQWLAITAPIIEMDTPDSTGQIRVVIGFESSDPNVEMHSSDLVFGKQWQRTLESMKKGTRIYAVCKIADATKAHLFLNSSELDPP